VYGHLTPFPQIVFIRKALIRELIKGESTPHYHSPLPILRKDRVSGKEGSSASDMRGLFSGTGHIKRNSALPLGIIKNRVHYL